MELLPVYIFSDNQTAVRSATNPLAKQAQYLIKTLHEKLKQTLNPIQICWISALWHFVTPRRTGDIEV
jgi:hypothetical protein